MATLTAFPSLYSSSSSSPSVSPASSSLPFARFKRKNTISVAMNHSHPRINNNFGRFPRRIRSVAEESQETLITEEQWEDKPEEQPVSVPVSPSDILTMFFQAEGSMDESIVPKVTKALQEVEGISDLKVKVLEGIASVELKKQTTVQATGVASSLVEVIQGSGFKLQTLNLSFEDEEDAAS